MLGFLKIELKTFIFTSNRFKALSVSFNVNTIKGGT
ncbi:hypothetical protein QF028_003041 [Neobacillus sp. B4I6]